MTGNLIPVDARFAGGTIFVGTDEEYTGDGRAVVVLDVPGAPGMALRTFEARALANALLKQATAAGRRPLRRRADAAAELSELDG